MAVGSDARPKHSLRQPDSNTGILTAVLRLVINDSPGER